ncbi:MAG: GldG family protein [Spirochaetales bacterium]
MRSGQSILSCLRKLVFVFLLMVVLWFLPFRMDFTSSKVFTLSPKTKQLFPQLEDTVWVTYYVSPSLLRKMASVYWVKEQLYFYAHASKNIVDIQIVYPEHKELVQEALVAGLRPNASGEFSGITLEYRNRTTNIPWISEPAYVEYLLTAHLLKLLHPEKRRVGVLGVPSPQVVGEGFFPVLTASGFVPLLLDGETATATSFAALIVLRGEELSERWVSFLETYLQEGGRVLLFLDRVKVDRTDNLKATLNVDAPIFSLIHKWGIEVLPSLVLDQMSTYLPVQRGQGVSAEQFFLAYPAWVRISGEGFNRDHPITKQLAYLDLFWASPLKLTLPKETTLLATSSIHSWIMREPLVTDPLASELMQRKADASYFPLLALVEKPSSALLIVGDGDCMSDLVDIQKSYENYTFLLNAVEWLSDPEGLMALRNRFLTNYMFSTSKSYRTFLQAVHLGFLPFVFLLAGLLLWVKIRHK